MSAVVIEPGSPAWLRLMTASKVSAVLGVSKYDSPRSLWHKMRGDVEPEPATDIQKRGHYLEPGILAWFFDQHPELRREPSATVVHSNGWMAATPDAFAYTGDELVLVEAKSAANSDEWGTSGTDEIPVGYAAQCMWTLHVTGARIIYVPVLTEHLEFAEYVVHYNARVAAAIERRCCAFMDSLALDEPPAVDSHPETYQTLRRINPLIDHDGEVQLTPEQAALFVRSRLDQKAADAQTLLANSTVTEAMGTARLAKYGTDLVCRRQNTASGKPALYPARTLPIIDQENAA